MITVIGLGFVGLTTALGFAHKGYKVYTFDIDKERSGSLEKGRIPFMEPHLKDILKKNLGKKLFNEVELETIEDQPGGFTPTGTDFYQKIGETIANLDPGAKLVPILSPGSTDMLHFRKKGIHAYGLTPMKLGDLTAKDLTSMAHGYNERFSIENLMFNTRFFYDLSLKY